MPFSSKDIVNVLARLGLVKGTFVLFFFMAHGWIYSLYRGRLKDRQREINRLARENREYRDRFLVLMDRRHDIRPEDLERGSLHLPREAEGGE